MISVYILHNAGSHFTLKTAGDETLKSSFTFIAETQKGNPRKGLNCVCNIF